MVLVSSLLLLAAQVSAAAEPLPSEIHNFKDWVVTCDNSLRCQATSLVPEPTAEELAEEQRIVGTPAAANAVDRWDRFGALNLERDAGPEAPLTMVLTDFDGIPAKLMLNEQELPARLTMIEEGSWRIEPTNRNAFFDALYGGTLLAQDRSGRTLTEIGLSGLWEALVYMDERQARLRTPTAAVRRGRRAASFVPGPVALPVVQVAPRTSERPLPIPTARMTQARREMGCTEDEVGAVASGEAATHALGNGRTLVIMACGAGAYNFNAIPLIAWQDGRTLRVEAARFDVSREPMDGEPAPRGYSVTNADFDEESRTIGEYAKGRGIGDCGITARYAWDGQMFRLIEQREMSECRGSREMLTTWRAQVR